MHYFLETLNYQSPQLWSLLPENIKGCACYIFASLFLSKKESFYEIRRNVFYMTSKALFVLEKIKV